MAAAKMAADNFSDIKRKSEGFLQSNSAQWSWSELLCSTQ